MTDLHGYVSRRLCGRESHRQCIHDCLKPWLHINPGHDSLFHMGGVYEDRNGVSNHTGSSVEIEGAEFSPCDPIFQHLPDEPCHSSRIVGDKVRTLRHDSAVQTMDFGVVSQLGAFAAMECQHETAQPVARRPIGVHETGGQLGFLGHGPCSQGIEDIRFGTEVPVDGGMGQAHGLGDIDHVGLCLAKAANLLGSRVEDAVAMIGRVICHAQVLADK